jgi:hypothetical protein
MVGRYGDPQWLVEGGEGAFYATDRRRKLY